MAFRIDDSPYGAVSTPYGRHTSLSSWSNAVDRFERQQRGHEQNMQQLEYLAALQALGLDSRGRPLRNADPQMNEFLSQWQGHLNNAAGIYNQALEDVGTGYDFLKTAQGAAGRLGDLASTFEQEYETYRQDMGGIEGEFRQSALDELTQRRQVMGDITRMTTPDVEGAAGRAMADVAQQSEIARQNEARRLQSMGVDPTSGRYRALFNRMGGDEAMNKAVAANIARREEENVAFNRSATAAQLLNPTQMASTALAIRQGGNEMLQGAASLRAGEVGALTDLTRTAGDLASARAGIGSALATNVAGQYGEMGGLIMGMEAGRRQAGQTALQTFGNTIRVNPPGGYAVQRPQVEYMPTSYSMPGQQLAQPDLATLNGPTSAMFNY